MYFCLLKLMRILGPGLCKSKYVIHWTNQNICNSQKFEPCVVFRGGPVGVVDNLLIFTASIHEEENHQYVISLSHRISHLALYLKASKKKFYIYSLTNKTVWQLLHKIQCDKHSPLGLPLHQLANSQGFGQK